MRKYLVSISLIFFFLYGNTREFNVFVHDVDVDITIFGSAGTRTYPKVNNSIAIQLSEDENYFLVVVSKQGFYSEYFILDKYNLKLKEKHVSSLKKIPEINHDELFFEVDAVQFFLHTESRYRCFEGVKNYLNQKAYFETESDTQFVKRDLKNYLNTKAVGMGISKDRLFFPVKCYVNSIRTDRIILQPSTGDQFQENYFREIWISSIRIKWVVEDVRLKRGEEVWIKEMEKVIEIRTETRDSTESAMMSELSHNKIPIANLLEFSFREFLDNAGTMEQFKPLKQAVYSARQKPNQLVLDTIQLTNTTLQQNVKNIVTVKNKNGVGTGCLVNKDGYIVSTAQLFQNIDSVSTVAIDAYQDTLKLKTVYIDLGSNLVLLKADKKYSHCFSLNTVAPMAGEDVYVMGISKDVFLSQSVSKGIVSGMRKFNELKFIQTDASINQGNEGGALVNANGELVGIVNSKIIELGVQGLGFVVPVERFRLKLVSAFK